MSRFANSVSNSLSVGTQSALLELMVNPEKHKAAIQEMFEKSAELDAKIAVVGEVNQIHEIRAATDEAHAKAVEHLRKTEEECAKMRKDAADHLAAADRQCAAKLAEHIQNLEKMREEAEAKIAADLAANQAACAAKLKEAELVVRNAQQNAANTDQECHTRKKVLDEFVKETLSVVATQSNRATSILDNCKLEIEAQCNKLTLV